MVFWLLSQNYFQKDKVIVDLRIIPSLSWDLQIKAYVARIFCGKHLYWEQCLQIFTNEQQVQIKVKWLD